jgi:hypothetical protein
MEGSGFTLFRETIQEFFWKKTTKHICQDERSPGVESILQPPEYEDGVLTAQSRYSVKKIHSNAILQ